MIRVIAVLIFLLFITETKVFSQILDDSTQQVYGPETVHYLLEKDVLINQKVEYRPDTLLNGFYKSEPLIKTNWLYQDLGNVGTASKPLFFLKSKDISRQMGLDVFNLYRTDPLSFKYYNSRSPYTDLSYTQGFKGYSLIDFLHSQNINPRLNITLNVSKYNSSKQIDATTAEEKLVDHWNYEISSNYFAKNQKYKLFTTFYHLNHSQNEQGGILEKGNLSIEPKDLLSSYRSNYQSQLENGVYNREKWNNLRLYHQYVLASGFQIFHVIEVQNEKRIFLDPIFSSNVDALAYHKDTSISVPDTLIQNNSFRSASNKFGFKGRFKGFNYELYGKHRAFRLNNRYFESYSQGLKNEIFVGGALRYFLKDSTQFVNADAEFSINGFYINAQAVIKGIDLSFYQSVKPVGLFWSSFNNGYFRYENDFKSPSYTYFDASVKVKLGKFVFEPKLSNTLYGNYLYLNQKAKPVQNNSVLGLLQLNLTGRLSFSKIRIETSNIFSVTTNADVLRMPAFINYTNFESDITYAKVLKIRAGFDFFYKSSYLADAYSPMLNQFYLQDNFKVWGAFTAEPYLSFKIGKVRLAFKMGHVTQGLVNQGFYVSPYYLAMPRAFLLKVNWPLFD